MFNDWAQAQGLNFPPSEQVGVEIETLRAPLQQGFTGIVKYPYKHPKGEVSLVFTGTYYQCDCTILITSSSIRLGSRLHMIMPIRRGHISSLILY